MIISKTRLSLVVTPDPATLAEEAAKVIVETAAASIAQRGVFSLAVSGGKTPVTLFRLLASPQYSSAIDWGKTFLFWVDERAVSPEHDASNYRLARTELISRVDITRYYRIKGEDTPSKAARHYEELLQEHFGLKQGEVPRFDCILLGVGGDGHTASLFPGDKAVECTDRLVVDVYPATEKLDRVTLTLPVLNNARQCLFLAEGREKNHVLSTALNLMAAPILPAQMVRPHDGELWWIVDNNAYQG